MRSSNVGYREKKTKKRAGKLLDKLDDAYLGDWADRESNSKIEPDLLTRG